MSNRETFWQFITRPTGFGRTSWTSAILIHTFGFWCVVFALGSPLALLGLIAPVTLWWGTWMNWKGYWR